ncbi:MAG: hypothetical protein P1P89_05475 [Desulfobacterales bacterium]|nr:hypothetical protein [Desulfobacterales bacterium]
MKKCFGFLIAVFFVVGVVGISGLGSICIAGDTGPVLAMGTPLVKADKKASVVIMGSGFKPGEELSILVTDANGLQTDIGYALKPVPKADSTGTWATTWNAGRFVSRKVIGIGPCKITVTDADYNPLAHSVVFFQKVEKKDKK